VSEANPKKMAASATQAASAEAGKEPLEFGGWPGAIGLIVFSHFIVYYTFTALEEKKGALFWDMSLMLKTIVNKAAPTIESVTIYGAFILLEAILAAVLPGFKTQGLPIPHLKNKSLAYNCNAYFAWWVTLAVIGTLHFTGTLRLGRIATLRGPLLTCAVIFSDALSVCVYVAAFATKTTHRMSGNHLYDFFMGASLNPRIGSLDIKMWAEVRVSWITLFLLTLSEAAKQVEDTGKLGWPLAFMVLAHWLYANACCKGEELIVPTWDIFYEKYGWMLCYWNLCGVPFMYSFNSAFLNHHAGPVGTPNILVVALFVALLCAYYVFDTANAQKNIYRQQLRGAYQKRPWYIFPQFSYMSCGPNPKHIKTKAGSPLLVDGWYKYARKVHYTADASMAMMWGLSCGLSHFLPFFYFVFFSSMITHRALRDNEKCARKYGDDWVEYCRQVPYVLIPGVW